MATEASGTPGILVNRVVCSWDRDRFDERYGIVQVRLDRGKALGEALRIVDGLRPAVRSVVYGFGGRGFHALVEGRGRMGEVLRAFEGLDGIAAKAVPSGSVPRHTVLNLLAAALVEVSEGDAKGLKCSNPEGCLYCVDQRDVKNDRLVAMKFWFSESGSRFGDVKLEFPAVTFALLRKVAWDPRNKKAIGHLAHYRNQNGHLRRTGGCGQDSGEEDVYVCHGYTGMPRASLPFLDTSEVKKLDMSKMGRVRLVMRRMRREYADVGLELDFVRTEAFDEHHVSKPKSIIDGKKDGFLAILAETVSERGVRIIDSVGTDESSHAARMLVKAVNSIPEASARLAEAPEPGSLNIVLVEHGSGDENHAVSSDVPLQHVSLERIRSKIPEGEDEFPDKLEDIVSVMLSEAVVKMGIIEGRDPFFEWFFRKVREPVNGYERTWTFADRPRIPSEDGGRKLGPMYCLSLGRGGELHCRTFEECPEGTDMEVLWNMFNPDDYESRGVATDGENTFLFRRSDVVAIPEMERIRPLVIEKRMSRGKDEVESSLKACTDVRYCVDRDDSCYYMVGVRSRGMESKIQWGAHVYEMRRLDGTGEPPAVLFDMLQVPFVRYKRMTTVPYPFKYLREYELMQGLEGLQGVGPEDEPEEDSGGFTQMVLEDFLPGLRRRFRGGRRPLRAAETFSPRNPATSLIRVDILSCLHRFSQKIRQIRKQLNIDD